MRNCFWILTASIVCLVASLAESAEYFNPDGSISHTPGGTANSASTASAIDALYPETATGAAGTKNVPEPVYPPGIEPPKPLSIDPTAVKNQPELSDMPAGTEDGVGSNPALQTHTGILPSAAALQERKANSGELQLSGNSAILYEGKMVVDVKLVGNKLNSFEKILPYLKTRPGRPFSKKILEDDVRRLLRSRLFTMATPYFKETPDGLEVVFQVSERPIIQYVRYVGCDKIKKSALIKECSLKIGGAMDPSEVESCREHLETYYKEKGYAHASVNVVQGLQIGDPGVIFQINEGPKQKIHWVDFEGNTIASDARLRTQVQSKHGFLWLLGGELDYTKVDADIKTLEEYYKNLGYLDVHIGREVRFSEKEDWARITFYVNEGPRYKIRNMTIAGNTKYETADLQKELKINTGDYFNKPLLKAGISRIQGKYGKIGHVFADVKPDVRYLETPGECDLILAVKEGESYRVGKVNVLIAGDFPHTQIDTVLNRMSVRPGDIMDTTKIKASERRLKASQLFANDPARGVSPSIVYSPPEIKDLEKKDGEQMAKPVQRPENGSSFRGQNTDEQGYRHVVQFSPQEDCQKDRPTLDLTFVGIWAPNGNVSPEPPVWRSHLKDQQPIDDPQANIETTDIDTTDIETANAETANGGISEGSANAPENNNAPDANVTIPPVWSALPVWSAQPDWSVKSDRSAKPGPYGESASPKNADVAPASNGSDPYLRTPASPLPNSTKGPSWNLLNKKDAAAPAREEIAASSAFAYPNPEVVFLGQSFSDDESQPEKESSLLDTPQEDAWNAWQKQLNRRLTVNNQSLSQNTQESESDLSANTPQAIYDPSAYNNRLTKKSFRGQNVLVDPFGDPQSANTNKTTQELYAPDALTTTNSAANNSLRQAMYSDGPDSNAANYAPASYERPAVPTQPWENTNSISAAPAGNYGANTNNTNTNGTNPYGTNPYGTNSYGSTPNSTAPIDTNAAAAFPASPTGEVIAPTSGGVGQTGNMVQDNMSLYPGLPSPNSPQGQSGDSFPATTPIAGPPFMGINESPTDRYSLPIAATMEETMTGRMMFSLGVSSESGLLGSIVLDEQNFDWQRWPRSWRDWPNGTAFRGRGQRFRIEAMPGTQVQRYSVSFEEPYLFNTPISWGISGVYYERYYDEWYEDRIGGQTSLGYRFHQDLVGYLQMRAYSIHLYNPIYPTPYDLQEALGTSGLYGFSGKLVYDKRDSPVMATEGWYMAAEFEQVVGTFVYPRASVGIKKYITLFQRPDGSGRHVLSMRASLDWSGDDTPIYEHYFTGGYSTIRGFKYRDATVRDQGVTVGGHVMVLAGMEYMFPITADDMLKGVVFCDTGTSEKSFKNWDDKYRVSIGAGLRITIPWMGSAPIALDFAVPLSKNSFDRTEVFSFSMGGQF